MLGRVPLREAQPDGRAGGVQVSDDRAGIVQLVAGGDEEHAGIGLGGEVADVPFLALAPGGLGLAGDGYGIGAADDDTGDPVAELAADPRLGPGAVVGVLDGI